MTPPTTPDASTSPLNRIAVLEDLLSDGELVILAIKPSGLSILLSSAAVQLAMLAIAAAGLYLREPMVVTAAVLVAFVRLAISCCQWGGTLYVLTNRRVMCVRTLVKMSVAGCMLKDIKEVSLSSNLAERSLHLGNVIFSDSSGPVAGAQWDEIAHPDEVIEEIHQAIRHAR